MLTYIGLLKYLWRIHSPSKNVYLVAALGFIDGNGTSVQWLAANVP